jgi:hypothetical protein
MTAVVSGAGNARYGWRLVSRTGQGADVLAALGRPGRQPVHGRDRPTANADRS